MAGMNMVCKLLSIGCLFFGISRAVAAENRKQCDGLKCHAANAANEQFPLGDVPELHAQEDFLGKMTTSVKQENSPANDLFGAARDFKKVSRQPLTSHPRVCFDADEWNERVRKLAKNVFVPNSYAFFLMARTSHQYVRNSKLAPLRDGMTDAEIESLVATGGASYLGEIEAQAFFIQAQRAFIFREQTRDPNFSGCTAADLNVFRCVEGVVAADEYMEGTKHLLVNWARYSIRNREVNGPLRGWSVGNSFKVGGAGFVMALDVMWNELSEGDRDICLAAVGAVVSDVTNPVSIWGYGKPISNIWSNWAAYNSHIYVFNCVLENTNWYNAQLNAEYVKILRGFAQHSIYESGFTFEDGYTTSTALREGTTSLIALARREVNLLDTERFRKFIAYVAHSFEPWKCSNFIGHGSGSGGGKQFQSFLALFRYIYPDGPLTNMIWSANAGNLYSCYWKQQSAMDVALFGDENLENVATEPSTLRGLNGGRMALSIYGEERGLMIARSSLEETALYIHLNVRPDAMFPGHDNADRGSFTLTANRHTWVPELEWRSHFEAKKHSMLFIDGISQHDFKAAPALMVHDPIDDGEHVIATADLTYATTYKWSRPWSRANDDWNLREPNQGWEKELTDPRDFGFPKRTADELGLPSSLWGHPDYGFLGFYQWRAPYNPVSYNIRSAVLVRDHSDAQYFVVGDVAEKADTSEHEFTWEMTLEKTTESEVQEISPSAVILSTTSDPDNKLGVYVVTNTGAGISFSIEDITHPTRGTLDGKRLIVGLSKAQAGAVRFTVVLHPFTNGDAMLYVEGYRNGDIEVSVNGKTKSFAMDNSGRTGFRVGVARPSPSPSPSASPAASVSPAAPDPLPSWIPMNSAVDRVRPPPQTLRYVPMDSYARPSNNAQRFSDIYSYIFDPDAGTNFEDGYEHVFILLVYGEKGRYHFSTCRRQSAERTNINFYRFTEETRAKGDLYYAYQRRDMEKLEGLPQNSCSVDVDLEGPQIYIVGGSNSEEYMEALYTLI